VVAVPISVVGIQGDDDVGLNLINDVAHIGDHVTERRSGECLRPRLAGHAGIGVSQQDELGDAQCSAGGPQFVLAKSADLGGGGEPRNITGLAASSAAHGYLGAVLRGKGDDRAGAKRLVVGMSDSDE